MRLQRAFIWVVIPISLAAIALGVFLVLSPALVPSANEGTIAGTVTIGPSCPGNPPAGRNYTCTPASPSAYLTRQIVLQPESGSPVYISMNSTGSFVASVKAGTYILSITQCNPPMDCRSLPRTVSILTNQVTSVEISIPVITE